MKKFILLLLGLSPIWGVTPAFSQTDGEKAAILMVHFGTTYDDTRAKTIDAINQKVASEFPDRKVLEAYTSRIVIKRLKARGIEKLTPARGPVKTGRRRVYAGFRPSDSCDRRNRGRNPEERSRNDAPLL